MSELLSLHRRGQGPALVLLHAFPLDGRLFRLQLEAFAERFTVLVPDLRGFGRSRSLGAPKSIDQMADDVVALLDAQQLDRVTVAGVSLGGYVALGLLRRHPQRLARLILCDTRADADSADAKQSRARQLMLLHGGGGPGPLFDQMSQRLLADATGDAVRDELRHVALDQTVATLSGATVAMRDRPDASDDLATCPVPVLAVAGAHDQATPPEVVRAMADLAPDGIYQEIPGAGHLSCRENPDVFNRTLLDWLGTRAG